MNTSSRSAARALWVAVRAMVLFTAVLGVGYTFAITGIGQLVLPGQAAGSVVRSGDGAIAGSSLIGQGFVDSEGDPLPQYFQSRPSAAGDGWDGRASSGSNLGPNSGDLLAAVIERREQIARFNGVAPEDVPADAVTASGSGLDPHITPEYARIQVDRVAEVRGLDPDRVAELVRRNTAGRDLGYLGEPRVNVLELNLALDELDSRGGGDAGGRRDPDDSAGPDDTGDHA